LPLLWRLSVQLAGRISATEEAPWTGGNSGSTLAAPPPISSSGAPMARSSPRSFRPKTPRITPMPPRRGFVASGVTATSWSQTSRWARPLPRTPCRSARALLLIDEGFGDLPIVRRHALPRLFELAIRLPELLCEDVAEIPGRLIAPARAGRANGAAARCSPPAAGARPT